MTQNIRDSRKTENFNKNNYFRDLLACYISIIKESEDHYVQVRKRIHPDFKTHGQRNRILKLELQLSKLKIPFKVQTIQ